MTKKREKLSESARMIQQCRALLQQVRQAGLVAAETDEGRGEPWPWPAGATVGFGQGGKSDCVTESNWHPAEGDFRWMSAKESALRFRVQGAQDLVLQIDLRPLRAGQRFWACLNGFPLGESVIGKRARIRYLVPKHLLQLAEGDCRLLLATDQAGIPKALKLSEDKRRLSLAVFSISLTRLEDLLP